MALRKYRYKREGSEFGPLDESVMRTLVASGEILPDDMVYSEETRVWAPASEVFVFPKKRAAYQVPPQLAHPPSKYELARPWIYVLIGVLVACATVLVWSVRQTPTERVQQAGVTPVAALPKKKSLTAVDRAIEEMKQVAIPKQYDELVAALESPPAPPAEFERPAELVRWWSAYSQLYDRYWSALTEVQQQRVPGELLAKWRAPWRSAKLLVKEVRGDVREVRSTAKTVDVPTGRYYVELADGPLSHCILYGNEEEVARISKGAPFQATGVRVLRIEEDKISRLFPEDRQTTIWYETASE